MRLRARALAVRACAIAVALLAAAGCQTPAASTPTVAPAPTPASAAPVAPTASAAAVTAPSAAARAASPSAGARVAASPSGAARPVGPSPVAQATAVPVGTSRVDTLKAANAAFASGDLKTASGLYDRVVNTPPPSTEAPAATLAIDDLADFRAVVLLLADGSDAEASTRLDALQQRDPTGPLGRLGKQLYDQYGMTGALRGACAQIQPQIATQAAPTLATLQGLGVSVDPATLCSVR